VSSITQGPPIQSQSNESTSGGTPLTHVGWLIDTGERLTTVDGKTIEVWKLNHKQDDAVLSAWATHFRNHYCPDSDIDALRGPKSRKEYLEQIKFPSKTSSLGPGIRAGDFGEILVADYLQFVLGFSVPRVRWDSKIIRDESSKGSDVVGFKFHKPTGVSTKDVLAVFESKTKFSGSGGNRLQDAIIDSAKDHIRIDESLNYIKQRHFYKGEKDEALKVERFQNPIDHPYRELFGAVALYTGEHYQKDDVVTADCTLIPTSAKPPGFRTHPKEDVLFLVVIKGAEMMALVHELYRRAADEA
jgi:hypothetical protein